MPTRHKEIAETLTNEILRGRYLPGDRLPSERDLSARFDANRGAVREIPEYCWDTMPVPSCNWRFAIRAWVFKV